MPSIDGYLIELYGLRSKRLSAQIAASPQRPGLRVGRAQRLSLNTHELSSLRSPPRQLMGIMISLLFTFDWC